MKCLFLSLLLSLFHLATKAQTDPLNSPYVLNGPYSVLSDSDMVASPAMYTYSPDVPAGTNFPVFIFQLGANGFGSTAINVHSYDLYLKHLASYGYVVVIVNSTQAGLVDGAAFTATWNWIQNKYNDAQHWLSTKADMSKVVVGGHSNGGLQATHFMLANSSLVKGIVYFASYPSPFFPTHNVSSYNGFVLSIAGSEDNLSAPNACRNGYNLYTSATCRYFSLITGLHHGGFGDYINASQPVGSIGRDSATATIRHHLVSFMESSTKNNLMAHHQLTNPTFQPGVIQEFLTNCMAAGVSTETIYNNNIKMWPNPVLEELFFDGFKVETQYCISDLHGKLISSGTLSNNALNLQGLTSGMYIIQLIQDNEQPTTLKFIKQ